MNNGHENVDLTQMDWARWSAVVAEQEAREWRPVDLLRGEVPDWLGVTCLLILPVLVWVRWRQGKLRRPW